MMNLVVPRWSFVTQRMSMLCAARRFLFPTMAKIDKALPTAKVWRVVCGEVTYKLLGERKTT